MVYGTEKQVNLLAVNMQVSALVLIINMPLFVFGANDLRDILLPVGGSLQIHGLDIWSVPLRSRILSQSKPFSLVESCG